MHTDLLQDIWVRSIGILCNYEVETVSDHLPIWIQYAFAQYLPRVAKRCPIKPVPRLDILPKHDATMVSTYNSILADLVDKNPQATHARRP